MTLTRRHVDGDAMRQAFVRVIEALHPGEVVSYGEVAKRAGYPNRHRAVGQLLSVSFDALPWWRVVYSSGGLPPCNPSLQEERLVAEGCQLKNLKVVSSPLGLFSEDESV